MDELPNSVAPEALGRLMGQPKDEHTFWQRQKALMHGRIEPMEKESMCLRIIKRFRVLFRRKDLPQ